MFRHLIRLMWNKKRVHALLIIEILASFLVLFGVTSLIIYQFSNYQQPLGYDYKNVWVISFDSRTMPDSLAADVMDQLKARTETYPQVEEASFFGFNTPMSMNTSNTDVTYNGVSAITNSFVTDQDMTKTLNVPVLEGRWFDKRDEAEGIRPIVINQPLKEAIFGNEPALGKTVEFKWEKDVKFKVIGVIGNYKSHGEYQENEKGVFQLRQGGSRNWIRNLLVKVKPGTDATFEAQLVKDLGAMTKDWNIEVSYMENQRNNVNNISRVPVIIFLVVSGFLIANVILGLFGILKLNIGKRREEIGLRRAMGATAVGISRQFVGEIWVLATFSILIGLLFAVQFPLMNVFDLQAGVYLTAIFISAVAIYLIVTVCALYPSRQAAHIQPAIALHED